MVNIGSAIGGGMTTGSGFVGTTSSTSSNTMKGWNRVLGGLQMVLDAAMKHANDDATIIASRISYHGSDLTTTIHDSSISYAIKMIQQQHQQQQHQQQQQQHQFKQVFNEINDTSTLSSSSLSASVPPTPNVDLTDSQYQQQLIIEPNFNGSQNIQDENNYRITVPTEALIDSRISTNTDMEPNNNIPIQNDATFQHHQSDSSVSRAVYDSTSMSTTTNISIPPSADITSSNDDDISVKHIPEGKAVPSTRFGRAVGFTNLGIGLVFGTAVEGLSRLVGTSSSSATASTSSIILNDANANRVASTLCRMRGAALKMGQMLSIQDESLLPPTLSKALQQVRQGAEAMPQYQLIKQMENQFGTGWKEKMFVSFDMLPFAAASIGQVHKATIVHPITKNVKNVVVKVQYPGVGQSIESDLRNLGMLVSLTGLSPKGLYIENVIRVGKDELTVECDYQREMKYQKRIKQLVEADTYLQSNRFVVPDVFPDFTTSEVLTSEYCRGNTIDTVAKFDQEERNRVGRAVMYLTMQELFVWRIMQTDPNWGNFLYDPITKTTSLIDFGAVREYTKEFVDGYLRIVWASANKDEHALMEQSYRMKFLTGNENEKMIRAHRLSGFTVGEPFYKTHNNMPFDFQQSNISTRMGEHTAVFLQHRLTPPPEEIYTLHRKLAGAYMLCIKLGAVIHCRDMLQTIVQNHTFDDGLDHPLKAEVQD